MSKLINGFIFRVTLLLIAEGYKTARPTAARTRVVLVHGAWGGGWDWKHVAVYRPTLSGLGEHSNIASTNIDLDTHIQDIENVILWENLHDVVLVGHSYSGMVIADIGPCPRLH